MSLNLRWFLAVTASIALGLGASQALAHGEVHPRIEALTKAIDGSPRDARLMSDRGTLYALDDDWSRAARDFAHAYALSPGDPTLEHHLGNALLHLGAPREARDFLDSALLRDPSRSDAHLLRARAHVALDELDEALIDFDSAIALAQSPSPETYLERADAIMSLAPDRVDDALLGLAEGRKRLGPLVTLIERTVELSRGEDALSAIAELPSGLSSTYRWQGKRASILREASRFDEASRAYRDALATIDSLPEGRRKSEATSRDRAEFIRALETLPQISKVAPPLADDGLGQGWIWIGVGLFASLLAFLTWRVRARRA